MDGKLKELRESRRMTQTAMGMKLGVTQQNISRYEHDVRSMPIDMLVRTADYFNVTTDYLLGRSEVKRGFGEEAKVSSQMDKYFDVVEVYRELGERDREIVWAMMEAMAGQKNTNE